jgi:hypothetical protein
VSPCLEGRAPREAKKLDKSATERARRRERERDNGQQCDRSRPLYPTEGLRGRNSINVLYLRRSEEFASVLEFRPTGHACLPLQSQFGQPRSSQLLITGGNLGHSGNAAQCM